MTDSTAALLYPSATPPAAAPTPAVVDSSTAPTSSEIVEGAPTDVVSETVDEPSRVEVPASYADVRWTGEPAASSTTDYASFTLNENSHGPLVVADPVMHDQALQAMQSAGLGVTQATFFYDLAKEAALNPSANDRATTEAQLRATWGGRYDANLAAVHGLIDQAQTKWPDVRKYLAESGLGNNPAFLIAAARKASGQ